MLVEYNPVLLVVNYLANFLDIASISLQQKIDIKIFFKSVLAKLYYRIRNRRGYQ